MTSTQSFTTLSYRVGNDGVAFIEIDVAGHKHNVLTPELHRELGEVAEKLAADEAASGAVIHSGKASFMAGGDLNRIVRYYDMQRSAAEAYEQSLTYTQSLRQLETCGKPVAVAINGTALGGGLELALAGHHRVVADDESIELGLPEVSLGLIPGGGGTQRLPRLIGLKNAADLIIMGKRCNPAQALQLGLVDQVVPATELLDHARRWVLETDVRQQPWDQKGFRVPGGAGLNDMKIGRLFQLLTARISADYCHNYPAPIAALRCLFNGTTVQSMDAALRIETREFSAITRNPVARNMIRTLFINRARYPRRELQENQQAQELVQQMGTALAQQTEALLSEGINPVVINNLASAAGLPRPAAASTPDASPTAGAKDMDYATIKQRLLAAPALAAAERWATDDIDPVQADLASVLLWDYPKYTGGVMSHIDTMGLEAFVKFCDDCGSTLPVSDSLRQQAQQQGKIYPPG